METVRQFLSAQVMDIGNALILALTALPLLLSLSVPMALVSFVLKEGFGIKDPNMFIIKPDPNAQQQGPQLTEKIIEMVGSSTVI